ncbi:DUF2892 domain-containing protein [Methylobacillus sp. Pita1]|uniref:YgaP family membrane protein n=1 Tax=Methylobacillus sp. Pita1 TaxID=3382642 RepID=UPI0038B43270
METNVGSVDRVLRVVVGVALIVWATLFQGPAWAYIGVLSLLTGLLRWCPAYTLFGLNTCKSKAE